MLFCISNAIDTYLYHGTSSLCHRGDTLDIASDSHKCIDVMQRKEYCLRNWRRNRDYRALTISPAFRKLKVPRYVGATKHFNQLNYTFNRISREVNPKTNIPLMKYPHFLFFLHTFHLRHLIKFVALPFPSSFFP